MLVGSWVPCSCCRLGYLVSRGAQALVARTVFTVRRSGLEQSHMSGLRNRNNNWTEGQLEPRAKCKLTNTLLQATCGLDVWSWLIACEGQVALLAGSCQLGTGTCKGDNSNSFDYAKSLDRPLSVSNMDYRRTGQGMWIRHVPTPPRCFAISSTHKSCARLQCLD